MVELVDGIRRVTFPLPLGIDHVHCYLLRDDAGWTVVDTGLGLPHIVARWRELLADLDAPVARIVITHMHPDHVGAAADVAELTGAPVYQGRVDHGQAVGVWGPARPVSVWAEHMHVHGTPAALVERILAESEALRPHVHIAWEVEPLDDGDRLGDWLVVHLPGHADGHMALYREDGTLIAGDAILGGITPTVGLWPNARPDPLGDFQDSLGRLIELKPRLALAGHEEPIGDPVARARALLAHHDERLGTTVEALADGPHNAYDLSLALFPGELPPSQRRFALAETLSHLERLVLEGNAVRIDGRYAAA
jgi:glyoxylase-like metal-dependent hydrolase (beta-lactamase superfamily II)